MKCIAICATMLMLAGPALAQGGGAGGFGLSFGSRDPYGPKYSSQEDVGGCVWRREWVTDHRGRRILKKIRICY